MASIYLTREIALGNGTRPAGFYLGDCEGPLVDLCTASITSTVRAESIESIEPAEGVEIGEILTALRNPDLVTDDEPGTGEEVGEQQREATPAPEQKAPAWRELPVERLAVEPQTVKLLRENGLKTLGQLDDYAQEHKGLTNIKGIGESTEKQIASAMAAILEANR